MSGRCVGILQTSGRVCGKKCEGTHCKVHSRVYERENPTQKLIATNTDVVGILNTLRTPRGLALLEQAVQEMLVARTMYPPSQNVNRFVTGGIAEEVLTDVLTDLGYSVDNIASVAKVYDLAVHLPSGTLSFSVKQSGDIKHQPILENYHGETKTDVRPLPPTLIFYTEPMFQRARIVYLDHNILCQAFPKESDLNARVYTTGKSSLTFRSGLLSTLLPKLPDAYIVNIKFPTYIPVLPPQSITRLALQSVRMALRAK